MLSKIDIEKYIGKGIYIVPFTRDNIKIDCQVKCNTIREKNFEAPRRESEN